MSQNQLAASDKPVPSDPDELKAMLLPGFAGGPSGGLSGGVSLPSWPVRVSPLDTYTPVRISDVPEFDIAFVDSVEAPMGLGEPPTTVVAPAIGNAIFAATGIRLRRLPIRPGDLLAAART